MYLSNINLETTLYDDLVHKLSITGHFFAPQHRAKGGLEIPSVPPSVHLSMSTSVHLVSMAHDLFVCAYIGRLLKLDNSTCWSTLLK